KSLPQYGMSACLLSNNRGGRVKKVAAQLDVPCIPNALKPFPFGFRKALAVLKVAPEHAAMIGDQILTDVWGARRVGLLAILLKPLSGKDAWGTRTVSRRIEKLVWKRAEKNMETNSGAEFSPPQEE
ncbi:MAG: HAD hydrolase-like protein, partial [Clostridiales bacterium]|nr:HAD hydrolase-like protein [Clostridiales bacterium]